MKHLFPCKCVETNQLNNNLNKKSYDTFLHTEWSPAGVRAFLLRKIQAWCIMAMTVMYNGVQYAPASCRQSITLPHSTDVLWSVVGKFGKQALWMGSVEGQPIFTQLLVCSAQQLSKPAQCTSSASRLALSSHQCLTCLLHCNQPSAEISKQMAAGGRKSSLHTMAH